MWSYVGSKNSPSGCGGQSTGQSHQIVGFALGERGTKTAKVLQPQLPMDAHIHYCTDAHRPYKAIMKAEQHTVGKAHTHHIESLNNKLRSGTWLGLGEKDAWDSKSATALLHSPPFIWQRKFGASVEAPNRVLAEQTIAASRYSNTYLAIPESKLNSSIYKRQQLFFYEPFADNPCSAKRSPSSGTVTVWPCWLRKSSLAKACAACGSPCTT